VTGLPPASSSRSAGDATPGHAVSTSGIAAVAAAATPVVAAALLAVLLVAGGCRARPPGPGSPPAPTGSAAPAGSPAVSASAVPGPSPVASGAVGTGPRLLLVTGGPAMPAVALHDPTRPSEVGVAVELPPPLRGGGLAALAAAPDGRLAAISRDGAVWLAPRVAAGAAGPPDWRRVSEDRPSPALPGPVLGGTWSLDGSALVLVAGAPGSGNRRTALLTVPVDGSRRTSVEVPLEADGPSVASLPRGVVAFVGRDLRDRAALARITASGSFATVPVEARGVVAGGGFVALVSDGFVRFGKLADLERGALPTDSLPLGAGGRIGAVAIAPDGSAVAVVRLDGEGAADRLEILRSTAGGWLAGPTIALEEKGGMVAPVWLP
jgi:hypothetical protein